ncbi:MAG TPA: hypothetical protein VFV67_30295 [Actinophytocola sp.]|uniref:hypothetical protein n=1 Tax=Actinophytocola sp. TaxID=1872138 RepID=UPI002DBA61BB|nr:hypothetical protein [Actinophytocola sp.]HEU5474955.1 hypothetical protein [Actinophytocola sp.]
MRHPARYVRPLAAVALTAGLAVVAPAPATAAPGQTLADRIVAAGPDWRAELAAELAALPDKETTVAGPLRGQVLAATLRLPGTVELTGDTTIIARELVFTGGALRVNGNGHRLALYPVAGTRPDQAGVLDVITIDTSAHDAPGGNSGSNGFWGNSGYSGSRGTDGTDPFFCAGSPGGQGSNGDRGDSGGRGGDGARADSGTDISLDIPDGSADSYRLISRGGNGGAGGSGGAGGFGGSGGDGGPGGDQYWYCYTGQWPGAPGGPGGNGGEGGRGGDGGTGGSGGNAGAIRVTYPAGYDIGRIQYDSSGGSGGNGGSAGHAGPGGAGGWGGFGGSGYPYGPNGQPGLGGFFGSSGNPGGNGSPGAGGAVTFTQR